VRAAYRLVEIDEGCPPGGLNPSQERTARERIRVLLGFDSIKSVTRYETVIFRTPPAVQQACDNGKLPLVLACRVAVLAKDVKQEIGARIDGGEAPKTVAADFLPRSNGRHVGAGDAFESFCRALERGLVDLEDRLGYVRHDRAALYLATLQRCQTMLASLVKIGSSPAAAKKFRRQAVEARAELASSRGEHQQRGRRRPEHRDVEE
jgi:hypothetical protein